MKKISLTKEEINTYFLNGVTRVEQRPFSESRFADLRSLAISTVEKEFAGGQSGSILKLFSRQPDFLNFAVENSLLDLVGDLIGPDICLMGSCLFFKRAGSPKFASWHSDVGQHFEMFEKVEVVSTTIAVTASTRESGCIKYLPESHNKIFRRYKSENYANSLFGSRSLLLEEDELDLSRGIINIELAPGQCSFNNFRTIHSSLPNTSLEDRVLVNYKFMSASGDNGTSKARELLKNAIKNRILVRGKDETGFCNLVI